MIKIKIILNSVAYAVAVLAFIPLFPYLELTPQVAVPAALAAGILIELKEWKVGHRLPTLLSLLFFVFFATRFSADNVVGPAVNMLVILLAVRLLGEKTPRNYLQIYALSLFSLAAASLFDLSPLFLCYFLLMLTLVAVSLVLLTYHTSSANDVVSRPALTKILSVALFIPVASIPLIVLFFFVLPRTQYPLWNLFGLTGAKVTGFSEKVEPGSSKVVGDVRSIAFRVRSPKLPANALYWRGIVLNTFEGKAWVRAEPPGHEDGLAGKGETIRQTVFSEPGRAAYLIALNVPRSITGIRFAASSDFTYVKRGPPSGHQKYETVSSLTDTISSKREINKEFYLHLPHPLSARMAAVANNIVKRGKNDVEKLNLLKQFFISRKLRYATSDLPIGRDPLDEFLFDKTSGHCEFFASSFAVLLRAAEIPSRLVGGYHGGEYNELGGYYIVTEDMAHVWVEAYIAGKGWITIEPSQLSVNFARSGDRSRGAVSSISLVADTFSYYWNLAIINYDLERQLRLISSASARLKDLNVSPHPNRWWLLVIMPLTAFFAFFFLQRRPPIAPGERVLRKFLTEVQREYSLKRDAASTLKEFASKLDDPCADRFVSIYEAAIYRDRRLTSEELTQLKAHIKGLRNRARRSFHGTGEVNGP